MLLSVTGLSMVSPLFLQAVSRFSAPCSEFVLTSLAVPDRFGRVYNYEEGADLMHEENADGPGYKRWPDKVR